MLSLFIMILGVGYVLMVCASMIVGFSTSPSFANYATTDDVQYCTQNSAIFADSSEAVAYADQTGGQVSDGRGACLFYRGRARYMSEHNSYALGPAVSTQSPDARAFGARMLAPLINLSHAIARLGPQHAAP
jgi:hypothetical protein